MINYIQDVMHLWTNEVLMFVMILYLIQKQFSCFILYFTTLNQNHQESNELSFNKKLSHLPFIFSFSLLFSKTFTTSITLL